jgi:hypothetical protein
VGLDYLTVSPVIFRRMWKPAVDDQADFHRLLAVCCGFTAPDVSVPYLQPIYVDSISNSIVMFGPNSSHLPIEILLEVFSDEIDVYIDLVRFACVNKE